MESNVLNRNSRKLSFILRSEVFPDLDRMKLLQGKTLSIIEAQIREIEKMNNQRKILSKQAEK